MRISIQEYALRLAEVAALRSEDPHLKVGAVALTEDNRIIATAYNGLLPKFVAPPEFWDDRDKKSKFMIHAEQNLCALIKRGEAHWVTITHQPCPRCLLDLAAHGVQKIYFRIPYDRLGPESWDVAKFYGIRMEQIA